MHLIRNSLRLASKAALGQIAKECDRSIPPSSEHDANDLFADFTDNGDENIPPSSGCGRTPGPSSPRSWTTHPKIRKSHLLDGCNCHGCNCQPFGAGFFGCQWATRTS